MLNSCYRSCRRVRERQIRKDENQIYDIFGPDSDNLLVGIRVLKVNSRLQIARKLRHEYASTIETDQLALIQDTYIDMTAEKIWSNDSKTSLIGSL